jgi:pyruvate dehydrogenase E2 component (dihydrolipoamide acetyltransferase)
MSKILDMPKLSPTMEEGVLSAWHKKEGDAIAVDDLLADVETDKATMEFRAFDKGTLLKLLVSAGATVKLGQPVAVLGEAGEDISATLTQVGGGAAAKEPNTPTAAAPDEPEPADAAPEHDAESSTKTVLLPPRMSPPPAARAVAAPAASSTSKTSRLDRTEHLAESAAAPEPARRDGERVLASPYVRKAARERGVDLAGARGSGPGGRVVVGDLEGIATRGATEAQAPPAAKPSGTPAVPGSALAVIGLAEPEVHPLSMMRKTIARRLTEAKQTVPHFYLTIDVDAGELVALREDINSELASGASKKPSKDGAPSSPLKVSLNDLLLKACAVGLLRVPACNAQFTPDAILVHRRVDISVAVAVPDGLVTPVVRNADQKTVVAIAEEVRDLAARARAKKLRPEEMTNGTFSISNLGMFGIDEFAAVINPPEGAILAIGQVRDAAVVRDGAVAVGKMLAMTLSCDHRVVDGAVGAAFLSELRALLEHPMRILTG